MNLKWTKNPPTEAGWYWQRQRGYTGGYAVYVEIGSCGPRYYANDVQRASHPGLPIVDIEWAGPMWAPKDSDASPV